MKRLNRHYLKTGFFITVLLAFCALCAQAQSAKYQTKKDSLLKAITLNMEDTGHVKALLTLSTIYRRTDFDSALYFAQEAQKLAKKIDFRSGIASSHNRMANVWSKRSEFDSAKMHYEKALTYFEEEQDSLNMSRTINNIGLMLRYMDLHTESLEYFFESLEIKKEIDAPPISLSAAYQNIGITFSIMKEHESALKYFEMSLNESLMIGDSSSYYRGLMNISALYRDMGDYQKTIDTLNKAYSYIKRKGSKNWVGNCLYNLGISHILFGDTMAGINSFKEAEQLYAELGIVQRQIACMHRLGRVYVQLNQLDLAQQYAEEGLTLDPGALSAFQKQTLNEILADVYEEKGLYQKALKHLKVASHIRDSVAKEESRVKIVALQKKFDKESEQRQIAELSAETEATKRIVRRKEFVNYILWGIVVIILVIALMLFRLNRNKQMMNAALREKNQIVEHSLEEKDVLMREIHHRVQNNLQFVSSLLNMQGRQVDDEQTLEILKSCKQRIQSMALIHQKLYQEDSLKGIRIENYIQNLVDSLQTSYSVDKERIQTHLDVEPLQIDINTAISLGLILSELITNAYKYAFPENEKGEINIELHSDNSALIASVRDNGKGMDVNGEAKDSGSFGLKLVNSLAKKLKGELEFKNQDGTEAVLRIPNFFDQ